MTVIRVIILIVGVLLIGVAVYLWWRSIKAQSFESEISPDGHQDVNSRSVMDDHTQKFGQTDSFEMGQMPTPRFKFVHESSLSASPVHSLPNAICSIDSPGVKR